MGAGGAALALTVGPTVRRPALTQKKRRAGSRFRHSQYRNQIELESILLPTFIRLGWPPRSADEIRASTQATNELKMRRGEPVSPRFLILRAITVRGACHPTTFLGTRLNDAPPFSPACTSPQYSPAPVPVTNVRERDQWFSRIHSTLVFTRMR